MEAPPTRRSFTMPRKGDAKVYKPYDNRALRNIFVWFLLMLAAANFYHAFDILKRTFVSDKFEAGLLYLDSAVFSLEVLGGLALVIIYFVWKYRATANLVRLSGPQSVTPAGAVYWYFVPIASLWKPLDAMNNLYRGFVRSPRKAKLRRIIVLLWWITLIATLIVTKISDVQFTDAEASFTESQMGNIVTWLTASLLLDGVFYLFTVMIIYDIAQGDEQEFRTGTVTPPQPAPSLPSLSRPASP